MEKATGVKKREKKEVSRFLKYFFNSGISYISCYKYMLRTPQYLRANKT
jgi:hypothetical protein